MYVVRFDFCIFCLFRVLFPFIYFFLLVKRRLHLGYCTMIYISLSLCKIKNTLSLLMLSYFGIIYICVCVCVCVCVYVCVYVCVCMRIYIHDLPVYMF